MPNLLNKVWSKASAVYLDPIIKIQTREPSEQFYSLAIYHFLNPFFNL